MDMNTATAEIKRIAMAEGADLVGIANTERYEGAPRMVRPEAHLPGARSVVVMAIHHPDASVEWAGEPNPNWSGPFQLGMIPKLDTIALRVARAIERSGFTAMPLSCTLFWRHRPYKDIPYAHAASFSHMNAFVAAGLGEYGWHGMVMSPKYGPRQRIISVITDAPFVPDPLYRGEALCDRCNLCEKKCWGNNYVPEHLNPGKTISFSIEGKEFTYADVNRWRCFYGEQCHLDMEKLAKSPLSDEQGIYDEMANGVKRVNMGYVCSSFKHCMAKPIRTWDRTLSPGPRRKKTVSAEAAEVSLAQVRRLAKACGAERITVQPFTDYQNEELNFYPGFRKDEAFRKFTWVITIGRPLPAAVKSDTAVMKKNVGAVKQMTTGRLMIGVCDIARYLDDAGHEAMQLWDWDDHDQWPNGLRLAQRVVKRSGWVRDGEAMQAMSLITNAPLATINEVLASAVSGSLADRSFPFLSHIDAAGSVSVDTMPDALRTAVTAALPSARSLIVISAGFSKRIAELAGAQEAECGVSYQYAHYQSQREAFWAADDLALHLRNTGKNAVALIDLVPGSTGPALPYITAHHDLRAQAPFAAAAGIGTVGRNGYLLTHEFGPRQRFAFVITDAAVPASEPSAPVRCPASCRACVTACPMAAMSASAGTDASNTPFTRDEVKCEWARTLGAAKGEGVELLGWKLPDAETPKVITDAVRADVLAKKDPIQVKCYCNPNHTDTVIERCLTACPMGTR